MSFVGMVIKNLLRQRMRTALTVVGITIGIATVVALGAITAGLKGTADQFVRSGGAAFIVAQKGAADLSFSRIEEKLLPKVESVDGVAGVRGVSLEILSVGTNPFFFLGGIELDRLSGQGLDLVEGRLPSADTEVVLGIDAAQDLSTRLGDTVTLGKATFTVVGTFDSDVVWQRGGGFASLEAVQAIGNRPDVVTVAFVDVAAGADPKRVARDVAAAVPEVVTIADATEYGQVDQGFELLGAANTAISFLAVVIGGIGVMNTMIMAIFERTREIGILRAIGWSTGRILRMILLESVVVCLLGAALGSAFGVLMVRLIGRAPTVGAFLVPAYPLSIFRTAGVVALLVGLLGAIYPAIRASRLTPMEALRHE